MSGRRGLHEANDVDGGGVVLVEEEQTAVFRLGGEIRDLTKTELLTLNTGRTAAKTDMDSSALQSEMSSKLIIINYYL